MKMTLARISEIGANGKTKARILVIGMWAMALLYLPGSSGPLAATTVILPGSFASTPGQGNPTGWTSSFAASGLAPETLVGGLTSDTNGHLAFWLPQYWEFSLGAIGGDLPTTAGSVSKLTSSAGTLSMPSDASDVVEWQFFVYLPPPQLYNAGSFTATISGTVATNITGLLQVTLTQTSNANTSPPTYSTTFTCSSADSAFCPNQTWGIATWVSADSGFLITSYDLAGAGGFNFLPGTALTVTYENDGSANADGADSFMAAAVSDEPGIPITPEPSSLTLIGSGLAGLLAAWAIRRSRVA